MTADASITEEFEELVDTINIGLSDERITEICATLQEDENNPLKELLAELSLADTVDLIHKISPEDRIKMFGLYGHKLSPELFVEIDPDLRQSALSAMPAHKVADIVSSLDSDDALDLLINLDDDFQQDVIRKLSAQMRVAMEEGLSFPEDSAGRLMQREYVAVPEFWTVGKTVDYLRAAAADLPEDFFDIIVITPAYHVAGEIPLSHLLRAKRSEKLENLMLDEPHIIPADMDQEDVALLFRREGLGSAPVIDADERLIGVITVDDVIEVINEEAQEDILKLAGVDGGDLYRAVLSTTGNRFRWLFVNLLTAILASIVISFFEGTIEDVVALAILMPIVASMGGNAGTQALTVAVRALATKELSSTNTMRIIWKETLVGTLNGVAFAVIIGLVAALWYANPALGMVIASAMVLNLIIAGFCGAGIPIVLNKYGADPAVSSTVFLTTVTDVVGFFGFLGLAALFLS
ncbi:MAG: magnesium transporter [Pseudomonadota bacterium]